ITMHHIVSDGWSMGLLLNELSLLYGAFLRGAKDPLPELSLQYPDYAIWQRKWFQGEVEKEQLAYWTRQLSDLSLMDLPTDKPRPPVRSLRGATESSFIPADMTQNLKAFAQREDITLFMLL